MTPKKSPPAAGKAVPPATRRAERAAPNAKPAVRPGKIPVAPSPPEAPRPVAKALARKRTPQVAREMLGVEMRRIRSLFIEIGERYLAEGEGQIVAVIEALENRKLPAPCVERLLKEVRALRVKPRKGRRKDLARIEALVDGFRKTLEE